MRTLLRLGTVLTVFLGVSFVQLPMSQAVEVPRTLADQRPVGVGPVVPGFPIDYLGVLWDTDGAPDEHAAEEAEEHGAVRFRVDGAWTAWQPLSEDGANAEGQWGSALVSAGDAEAYQVRGVPADAVAPRAVALNTTDGPLIEVGRRPAGGANAVDNCLSRTDWGAEEGLRFKDGKEVWPTEFYDAQTMTVHHTATENNPDDPAATVRAIYRYHAVDKGWGDIGYNYLLDQHGRVYEGRWSGATHEIGSKECLNNGGGDGTDFAHNGDGADDGEDWLVTAGHTGGYNSGNMGAALLGNFTTHRRDGAEPAVPAVDALTSLLAEFATRHGLDPHAKVTYKNPVNGTLKDVNMISGHRDWTSTECPGERLYDDLPTLRDAVKAQMSALSVSVTSPAEGDVVSGTTVLVSGAASAGAAVTVSVDGAEVGNASTGPAGWSYSWNSTGVSDGTRTITATATKDGSSTTSSPVRVTVDNDADPVVVITTPDDAETVRGAVTVTTDATDDGGITQVDFSVDGVLAGTDTSADDGWSWTWNTVGAVEGGHAVVATAVDTVGQRVSHGIDVTVDNVGVTLVDPASGQQGTTVPITISGYGFLPGATVDLRNGEGTEPVVTVTGVTGGAITGTIAVGKTNGPRKDRPWDVAVVNPDGTSAVRDDGFTVLR